MPHINSTGPVRGDAETSPMALESLEWTGQAERSENPPCLVVVFSGTLQGPCVLVIILDISSLALLSQQAHSESYFCILCMVTG